MKKCWGEEKKGERTGSWLEGELGGLMPKLYSAQDLCYTKSKDRPTKPMNPGREVLRSGFHLFIPP